MRQTNKWGRETPNPQLGPAANSDAAPKPAPRKTPKLVHISEEAHAMLHAYCNAHDIDAKTFVSNAIRDAVREARVKH